MLQASDVIEALGPDPVLGFTFIGEVDPEAPELAALRMTREHCADWLILGFSREDTLGSTVVVTRELPKDQLRAYLERQLRIFHDAYPFDHSRVPATA